ncbi:MAG: 50S ribosomal protein L11 methyltransferase [Desulfobacteraceae bacterium]|nr:50S ribosomal protein L11 methyltransferase [Desulfobacteraceae bacterium]
MNWIEAKVIFSGDNETMAAELIADIFQNLGIDGVVVDDPSLEPEEGWGSDALPRPSQPAVTGYLPADQRLEQRRHELENSLRGLAAQQGLKYSLKYQTVAEEDWAESWKAFFFPEQISKGLVVKPTWREYTPQPGQQVIEIDPGMAFGTGTHPTTALCVQLLERLVRPGHQVLDVGTGSGILLIAAAKLGATRLTGVDIDPVAVEIARQNLLRNRMGAKDFDLACGHLVEVVKGAYDIVVANILAEVILELLDPVTTMIKPGGWFICSGIIQAYRDKVARKMVERGFEITAIEEKGEWVALAGRLEAKK